MSPRVHGSTSTVLVLYYAEENLSWVSKFKSLSEKPIAET